MHETLDSFMSHLVFINQTTVESIKAAEESTCFYFKIKKNLGFDTCFDDDKQGTGSGRGKVNCLNKIINIFNNEKLELKNNLYQRCK